MRVCGLYLSEIEEEAGVLSGLREVGEEHCDADEQYRGVLAHLTQRLMDRTTWPTSIHISIHISIPYAILTEQKGHIVEMFQVNNL